MISYLEHVRRGGFGFVACDAVGRLLSLLYLCIVRIQVFIFRIKRKERCMTIKERVHAALGRECLGMEDGLDKLLSVAYYMGRESKAVEASDKVAELLARMRGRADRCHFHRMAHSVIDDGALSSLRTEEGVREFLYDSDYSCWITNEVGGDETAL